MTSTHTQTTEASTSTAAVDAFLRAVATGDGIPPELYSARATLDATVPNWRMTRHGPAAIAGEYARWFADPGTFEELTRRPIDGGEVVSYVLTWNEAGEPHGAHHCHILNVDSDGLIDNDTVFCGGRWAAALLAQMAETANSGGANR